MMFWRQLGLSDAAAAVLAVLISIGFGGVFLIAQRAGDTQSPSVVSQQDVALSEPMPITAETVPQDDAALSASAEEVEASKAESVKTEEPLQVAEPAPTLDLVRVSPAGDAVVAGTAGPNATVVFLLNGAEVTRAQADGSGSFVGLFDIPVSDTPNAITVAAEGAGGALISDETVLVAAVAAPLVEELPVEQPVVAPEPEPVVAEPEPEQVAALETPEPEVEAPLVEETPVADETGLRGASGSDLSNDGEVQTDYSNGGDVEVPAVASVAPDVETVPVADAQAAPPPARTPEPLQEPLVEPQPELELAAAPEPEPQPVVVQDDVVALSDVAPNGDDPSPQVVAPVISASETPDAPTIVVANSSGVKVLQPARQPQAPTAQAIANVVIDTITYDTEGEVALLGRGSGDGFVRVYLNDKPVLTVPVDADGSWETPLADVDAGVYRLRIDELSADGTVTSRVETPFQREEVEIARDAPPTAVTVQPGSTLWAIAQDRFGEGVEYVRVYEANRDLIRDPDLIYPGQVFALPSD